MFFNRNNLKTQTIDNTVKPVNAVTCIKRSPVLKDQSPLFLCPKCDLLIHVNLFYAMDNKVIRRKY